MKSKIFYIAGIFLAVLFLVYSRHLVVKSSYDLQALEKQKKELGESNLQLEAQENRLLSPSRLKKLAPLYGLKEVSAEQLVFIKSSHGN